MSLPAVYRQAALPAPLPAAQVSSLLKLASPDTNSSAAPVVMSTAVKHKLPDTESAAGAPDARRSRSTESSARNLDASLVHADAARKAAIARMPAMQLMVGSQSRAHQIVASWQVHLVTASSIYAISQDRCTRYAAYLQGLRLDFAELEAAVKAHPLPAELPTLSAIFTGRLAAIDHDIAALGGELVSAPTLVKGYDHVTHLRGIADKPHLVVVHIATHCLGFLFGGQGLARRMPATWEEAKSLYAYTQPANALANQCIYELETYQARLPDVEYEEYAREVAMPWKFACHMLGQDLDADIKYS